MDAKPTQNSEIAVAYITAAFRKDYEECARYIASNYQWIDHTLPNSVHTTDTELQASVADAGAWSDEELTLHRATEALDGTVFLEFTITGTQSGPWRGVAPTGHRVSVEVCDIIRFDAEGKIRIEEAYFDALTQLRQLGVTQLPD